MFHVAVNFHYVGMPGMPHAGIQGLTAEAFRLAVEGLGQKFDLVSPRDVLRFAGSAASVIMDRPACVITFDDGLRCQFETALPILDDLGVPAAFFALAGPYITGRAATIHKLHWVRAQLGDARVSGAVDLTTAELGLTGAASFSDAAASESYRYDSLETARLKYFLNYVLDADVVDRLVTQLLTECDTDEQEFARTYYCTVPMVRDLARREYLGSHGVTHRPLAQMPVAQARDELEDSRKLFRDLTGVDLEMVSYPLGNFHAVSQAVGAAAAAAGYRVGYTMERAINRTWQDPLLLARCDVADAATIDSFEPRRRYMIEAPRDSDVPDCMPAGDPAR